MRAFFSHGSHRWAGANSVSIPGASRLRNGKSLLHRYPGIFFYETKRPPLNFPCPPQVLAGTPVSFHLNPGLSAVLQFEACPSRPSPFSASICKITQLYNDSNFIIGPCRGLILMCEGCRKTQRRAARRRVQYYARYQVFGARPPARNSDIAALYMAGINIVCRKVRTWRFAIHIIGSSHDLRLSSCATLFHSQLSGERLRRSINVADAARLSKMDLKQRGDF
jgi:hypothetical protein